MPTRADVIAYLAHAGLDPAEIMQSGYYLRTGQVPEGISQKAQETINYLGAAGLDAGGVERSFQYLASGQDPGDAPGEAAPVQEKRSLGEDPAYLAFRRALGLENDADATSNQVRIDALNRRAGLSLENLAGQGAQQRQGIADSFEARGVFRSGGRLRAQAEQQEGEARQAAGVVTDTADQTASLVAQLAERRSARERQTAEQGYRTASEYGSV